DAVHLDQQGGVIDEGHAKLAVAGVRLGSRTGRCVRELAPWTASRGPLPLGPGAEADRQRLGLAEALAVIALACGRGRDRRRRLSGGKGGQGQGEPRTYNPFDESSGLPHVSSPARTAISV